MSKAFYIVLLVLFISNFSAKSNRRDELDRVYVYKNSKLVGAWRADESGVVHIDVITDGDTLVFKARTDLGGLGNSSIDIKDDDGVPVENIQSPSSSAGAADFIYIVNLKKVNIPKVMSLQVFLNVDPERNLPPPNVATIMLPKK